MYARLLSFINNNNILFKFQFGFREGHSPELALIYLVDKLSEALEDGDYVLGVFLDFSKAFDTVNHDILFQKLEVYGIRGIALNWFRSYLDSRVQYVEYDGEKSDYKNISCGVPQGSILGPLLFLLYINDLSDVSEKLFSLLFADDSNMFITGRNVNDLISEMNTELEHIIIWLNVNKLSLNLKKTHFMIFRKGREKITFDKELMINNTVIHMATQTKFLGVIIDENLSFKPHIAYVKGKISKSLGILYKCKKFFKEETLLTLYNSFVYPYFIYCITIWGSTYQTYLDPLVKLQKRAIRVVAGVDWLAHTAPLFTKLKLLRLDQIYVYYVELFMFRFHHNKIPIIFSKFYTKNRDCIDRKTRQSELFYLPIAKSPQRERSMRFTGVIYNNYLYDKLGLNVSYPTYKKALKRHLTQNDVPKLHR